MKKETKDFLENIGYLNYSELINGYELRILEPKCFTIKIPNEILNVDKEIKFVFQHIFQEIIKESIEEGIEIGKKLKAKEIRNILYLKNE